MRNGQNKRMRGRNRKGGHHQNPLSRMYESSGPDVKIRGTASHVAEKYLQLARDAQSSGDPVAAENYYQHAEHYFRVIAAAQEQLRQSQPYYQQQQPSEMRGADDSFDDGDNEQPHLGGEPFAPRESQPYYPREQHHGQPQNYQPQQHARPQRASESESDVERLPSFITGGQQQHQPSQQGQGGGGQHGQNGPTGPNGYDGPPDRFPLHRRRRRHRGGGGPREHSVMDHSMPADDDGSHSVDE
ncbi:MAG TPA: DUF4167 domain-containing protein [Xanthobacteraceae bacterium]|nr:DUF4167 domain-containing protein [Xanthobacteraceae bacterium]